MLVGYARVSTLDQNPALQIDALQAAGCEKLFTEKASGAQRERAQLYAALDFMRSGDTLVVWKLDRLARSMSQLITTIDDLEGRGVGFKSLTENIDTTTAGGRLLFHLMAALAEFERSIIKERTVAGLEAARKQGRLGGRRRALTDKDIFVAKQMLTDPNIKVEEVATYLKVSPSTLYRYLKGGRSALENLGGK